MNAVAHPPKHEVFDVRAMTNTDNKGFVRAVAEYHETPYGLYMSRTADHPRFHHLESWLLPGLGLRANIFHLRAIQPPITSDLQPHIGQRLYLDVGRFSGPDDDQRWHATDWYLDLVDHPGEPLQLIDVDELFDAHAAGLVTTAEATEATEIAVRALRGAAQVPNIQDWLDEQVGEPLTWLDSTRELPTPV